MDLEKQINAKQKALKWEEEPYKFETLQTLGDKERRTNDELQDARKEIINVSNFYDVSIYVCLKSCYLI